MLTNIKWTTTPRSHIEENQGTSSHYKTHTGNTPLPYSIWWSGTSKKSGLIQEMKRRPPPRRMFLDCKLVPDRPREWEYNLNHSNEFNTRHFHSTKLYFIEFKCNYIILNNQLGVFDTSLSCTLLLVCNKCSLLIHKKDSRFTTEISLLA